jgi:hypothetical protein
VSTLTKKVLTSLATAGLLAGLLGSALIPVARAVEINANETGTHTNGLSYDISSVTGDNSWTDAEEVIGSDVAGDDVDNGTGLKATSPVINFSPAMVDDNDNVISASYIVVDADTMNDKNGDAVTEADNSWKAVASGDILVQLFTSSSDSYDCDEDTLDDYSSTSNWDQQLSDGYVHVCVVPKSEGSTGTGTVTLSVKNDGDTTAVQTFYFDNYGPVASITATAFFSIIAVDTDGDYSDQAILTYKDASGTDLIDNGIAIDSIEDCSAGSEGCGNGETEFYLDGSYDGTDNAWRQYDNGVVQLDSDLGDELDLVAGDSFKLYAFVNTDMDSKKDSSEVKSNEWTIKLSGAWDGSYISDIAGADVAQRASTLAVDREIDLNVTMKDEDGNPLGYLGNGNSWCSHDASLTLDFDDNADFVVEPDSNLDVCSLVVVDGKGYEAFNPVDGATAYTLTVGDKTYMGWNTMDFIVADPTYDGGDETTFTVDYRVTAKIVNLVVTGKTACASFGKVAAGKQITFLVEYTKAGASKVVYRYGIANSAGKACYTVLGANRTITALFGSDASDTKTVK